MDEILDTYEPASCFDKVKGGGRGRPKMKLNATGIAVIEAMASLGATEEEIAGCLRCTVETLHSSYNEPIFSECIKKGRNDGKMSLRRTQFRLAQESATMAIWLGKQILGQREKPIEESRDTDDTPVELNIIVEDATQDE